MARFNRARLHFVQCPEKTRLSPPFHGAVTCLKQCPPIDFRGVLTMADVALPGSIEPAAHKGPKLDGAVNPLQGIIYAGVIAAALLFVAYSIYSDVDATGTRVTSFLPYLLLLVALLIALGFV